MRRLATLCGLCLVMTGAAYGAQLTGVSRTHSAATHAWVANLRTAHLTPDLSRSVSTPRSTDYRSMMGTDSGGFGQDILLGRSLVGPVVEHNPAGTVEAFAFRAQRGGAAASVGVYLDRRNRATSVVAGLYSSRHGRPASLLTSGVLRAPKSGTWNSVVVRSAKVRAGQIYWIAVRAKSGTIYFRARRGGICKGNLSVERTARSLPRRWFRNATSDACQISAYVGGATTAQLEGNGTPPPAASAPGTAAAANEQQPSPAPTAPSSASAPAGTPAAASNGQPLPPAVTAPPTIGGTPTVGQTLTTSSGTWINSPLSYAYQWRDCTSGSCSDISDATSYAYTVQPRDVGQYIEAVVVATNAAGSTSATSAAVGPVAAGTQPSISTVTRSNITGSTATFKATVNPNGVSTTVAFEYGTTTSYGLTTPSQNIGAGTTPQVVTASVTGLTPGTSYHVRAVALQ